MANLDPKRLVERGLFPENLPSVFTTQAIWQHLPPLSSGYALTANAVGEICSYDISKRGNQRRVFGIPHPLFIRDQGVFFDKHWSDIDNLLSSSNGSVSKPILDASGNRHVRITPHSDLSRIRLKKLSRFKFCLVTDVSRFYPSIYSHSIPWAINGKASSKLDNSWKSDTVFGNRLDFCVRQAQSRQTLGIPVGPDSSKIVSEIIMCAVDRAFAKASSDNPPIFVRHVDDYWIGGHTSDECEQHLRNLRSALKDFSLDINETKAKIVSTKFVFGEVWPSDIERAIRATFHSTPFGNVSDLYGRDPLATLGMIVERAVELNDDGIIKHAIRVLDRNKLWDSDWEILEHFLAQCAVQFPHSFDYVARVIAWRLRLNKSIDKDLWIDISRHAVIRHGELGRDSETCWSIWLLKELDQKLLKKETDIIVSNTSPLVLAFLAHFSKHKRATDPKLLSKLRAQISGDPFAGEFLPLSLELMHLGAGDTSWLATSTVAVLRSLHLAKASIITWSAPPAVFSSGPSSDGDLEDEPDYAIEDIGSDYIDNDEDEDDPNDFEDNNNSMFSMDLNQNTDEDPLF